MEDQTYYYLKLKENFFDTDEIKVLESMENGYLYSNILLKLYLKALKNKGKLTFNDFIPYDVKMLATITNHNVDVVSQALKIFQSMGLIEVLDNGAIYMLNMQQMIGSITSEGIRKAEYRERIRLEKENGTKLGQCPNIISVYNSNSNSTSNSLPVIKEKVIGKEKEKEREKALEKESIEEQIKSQDEELQSVLSEFVEMRKKIKKPMTNYAFTLMLKKLNKLSNGFNGDKILILNQSIVNCWQDIYQLKDLNEFSAFNEELVKYAKELSKGKGDKYALAILNSWKQQDITTLEMAKQVNELYMNGIGNPKDNTIVHTRQYTKDDYANLICDIDDIEI